MLRRNAVYGWALVSFAASEALARALGVRFASETLGTLYQYLDPVILREDLARGLYYLHAQPPLFNLGLGMVLKLFPESYPFVLSLLFGLAALLLLLGMTWLMKDGGVSDLVTGAVVLVFALSPNFVVYRNWLFYTMPVALLLIAGAVSLSLYSRTGRRFALGAFALFVVALMLTRSIYHPLYLGVVVAALVPFLSPKRRREVALVAVLSLLAVNLWFLKNQVLVDSYSASTWVGLSLAKRWPISQDEMRTLKEAGALPPFWHRRPFLEPDELRSYGFFEESSGVHPALDAPYRSNGEPNFNHRDYVEVSDAMLEGSLYLIRNYPGRYLQRVGTAFLLYLQPGPNSVHFLVDYDFERVHAYRNFLTRYVFLGGEIERPIGMLAPRPNLFIAVFAAALLTGAYRLVKGPPEARPVETYMLVSVLWVTLVANLLEIGENDRMRWEIEPFLAVWLGGIASAVLSARPRGA
jgi:hypothetical protein